MNVLKGKIMVDEYLTTNVPHIYAAGDCTGRVMLAHYAAYQGKIAAGNIGFLDKRIKADNEVIPSCIFTEPEIASVGLNEEKARSLGQDIKIHRFDFIASGMAQVLDETEGFIKVVSSTKTAALLGASIIGPRATELIALFSFALTNKSDISAIRKTIFAHPTISEVVSEAVHD